jgi:ribosomal protein L11 methyltransferase
MTQGIVKRSMNPEDPLYIYELEGTLTETEGCFQENFIAHWREGDSTFLFFSKPQDGILPTFLKTHPDLNWVRTHIMDYKDWQGEGLLDSLTVGKFIIVPPGHPKPPEQEKICLRVDPGVVFGSGHHPTTRDSLLALQWVYNQEALAEVLDLGTGTGILSLAAVALGAKKILAVDWNPACVQTAQKNVVFNNLQTFIEVQEGRAEEFVRYPADLLLANLHFSVIQEVIKDRAFFEKKWVILSGLLRSEFLEVKYRLNLKDFEIIKEWDSEFTWFTLLGRNKERP